MAGFRGFLISALALAYSLQANAGKPYFCLFHPAYLTLVFYLAPLDMRSSKANSTAVSNTTCANLQARVVTLLQKTNNVILTIASLSPK